MNNSLLAVLFFIATVALYALTRTLYRKYRIFLFSPILLTSFLLLLLITITRTPFAIYYSDTHWLTWLLGPATIAFAYPIYIQRSLLRRFPLTLLVGALVGLLLGLLSSFVLARLFGLPPELAQSNLFRSVSTPFAISATAILGGEQGLTLLCVMLTGICGMLIGEVLLLRIGLRSGISRGAAYGASAHALGTSKAYELGVQEGSIASLIMIFDGVAMVLLAPCLASWV